MQNKEKILDDLAKLAGGTVSVLSTVRKQAGDDIKARVKDAVAKLDLVPREDFERLEAMVIKLREEQEELKKQFPQKKKATAKKKAAPKRATKNAPAKKTKKASK